MDAKAEPRLLQPRLAPSEQSAKFIFMICAALALGFMALIMVFLFKAGMGLFLANYEGPGVSLTDFFFNTAWYPTYDPPDFGIGALIVASLAVTALSSIIAAPLGLGLAVYLSQVAGERVREIVKPAVELLAAIPSVVLGFVGMVLIAPFMQSVLDVPTGLNLLNAGLLLALMATPTVASMGEDALSAVPKELRDASYALGATRWETIWKVTMPAAVSGLTTAIILGLGRALGETMVVLMVAGGSAQIPTSVFDSIRPLTSTLAAEMAETPIGSHHYYALFAIGVILFLMTLCFNLLAFFISRRWRSMGAR
ncbi:phosphate ABC transporter permease subunit PstC [Deltaproteobacteria bacterium Smac51]|nr:phosphate ABC transporter permease subunit PstC [Deltaproteobacteria bacterium Smac51]